MSIMPREKNMFHRQLVAFTLAIKIHFVCAYGTLKSELLTVVIYFYCLTENKIFKIL
jgi:hypothetical protein